MAGAADVVVAVVVVVVAVAGPFQVLQAVAVVAAAEPACEEAGPSDDAGDWVTLDTAADHRRGPGG